MPAFLALAFLFLGGGLLAASKRTGNARAAGARRAQESAQEAARIQANRDRDAQTSAPPKNSSPVARVQAAPFTLDPAGFVARDQEPSALVMRILAAVRSISPDRIRQLGNELTQRHPSWAGLEATAVHMETPYISPAWMRDIMAAGAKRRGEAMAALRGEEIAAAQSRADQRPWHVAGTAALTFIPIVGPFLAGGATAIHTWDEAEFQNRLAAERKRFGEQMDYVDLIHLILAENMATPAASAWARSGGALGQLRVRTRRPR